MLMEQENLNPNMQPNWQDKTGQGMPAGFGFADRAAGAGSDRIGGDAGCRTGCRHTGCIQCAGGETVDRRLRNRLFQPLVSEAFCL